MITRLTGRWWGLSAFAYHNIGAGQRITVEHLFQAEKAANATERNWIMSAASPATAKARGSKCTLPNGWDDGLRVIAMRMAIDRVFTKGSPAACLLLSTGFQLIQHGNSHGDDYWGMVKHGAAWTGTNMYGTLLMERRSVLANE